MFEKSVSKFVAKIAVTNVAKLHKMFQFCIESLIQQNGAKHWHTKKNLQSQWIAGFSFLAGDEGFEPLFCDANTLKTLYFLNSWQNRGKIHSFNLEFFRLLFWLHDVFKV